MHETVSKLLTEDEAAKELRMSPATLATWRCTGRYPLRFIRMGRSVRYRMQDLEAFIRSRTVGADEPNTP